MSANLVHCNKASGTPSKEDGVNVLYIMVSDQYHKTCRFVVDFVLLDYHKPI